MCKRQSTLSFNPQHLPKLQALVVAIIPILAVSFQIPQYNFILQTRNVKQFLSQQRTPTSDSLTAINHYRRRGQQQQKEQYRNLISTIKRLSAVDSADVQNGDIHDLSSSSSTLIRATNLEEEFKSMMSTFESFSDPEIESVSNPRLRLLYRGVKAGSFEPNVYRAFEILYVDMVPIRLAGRMIFRRLKDIVKKSVASRVEEETRIAQATGLHLDKIDDGRKAFMAIKADKDEYMTLDQLVESGIVHTVVELSSSSSSSESLTYEEFINLLKVDKKGRLSFENFMIGLQQCDIDSNSPNCQLASVLKEVEKKMGPIEAKNNLQSVGKRKEKYSKQFDDMLDTFQIWETKKPKGESRMLHVLQGCFDGAKNKDVVGALKVVYVDYSAMRVAGNLIFSLTSKLIE